MLIRNYSIERKYFDMLSYPIYDEKLGDITLYACPECNEGTSYGKKHRFHWVFDVDRKKDSYFHCFNCDFAMSFEYYIRKVLGQEVFSNLLKEYNEGKEEYDTFIDSLHDDEFIFSPITISDTGFYEVNEYTIAYEYLKTRKLENFAEKFLTDNYGNLIIPMYNSDKKMYGYQKRFAHKKEFSIELDRLNRKFKAWNLYEVNLEEDVYIFEGVEDALSSGLDNVIAVMGKNVHEHIMNILKKPIICFDNDNDGKKSAYKHILKYPHAKLLDYPNDFKYEDINDMLKDNHSLIEISNFIKNNVMENNFRLKMKAERHTRM